MANVLDFHTHIFPDAVAQKATDNVGNYYTIQMEGNGTAKDLLQDLQHGDVTHALVFSSATKAHQVENINQFIAENVKKNPQLIGFGTLHQDYEPVEKEVKRIIELGLKGIKLHPDFQHFAIDDPAMFRIYEQIEGKLPLLIHVGDTKTQYSKPAQLAKVMELFPKLTVIAAHMGGYSEWELAEESLYGKNVYFDTSSSFIGMTTDRMRELIYEHGVDKILFGSDYPHRYPSTDYRMMLECGLKDEEYEKIFWKNGAKLLNL